MDTKKKFRRFLKNLQSKNYFPEKKSFSFVEVSKKIMSDDQSQVSNPPVSSETDWTPDNMDTLYEWITISSYNIHALEQSIYYYRSIVRRSTVVGLVLSTLSGTLSATQMVQNNDTVKLYVNGAFIVMSFTMAIFTGFIKIYQIQEKLEEFIRLKQEWISFSTSIVTEIQLPLQLRQSSIKIINQNKLKYLDLLKSDMDIPLHIKEETAQHFSYIKSNDSKNSIEDIILRVAFEEHATIHGKKEQDKDSTPEQYQIHKNLLKNEIVEELKKHYETYLIDMLPKEYSPLSRKSTTPNEPSPPPRSHVDIQELCKEKTSNPSQDTIPDPLQNV